MMEDYEVRGVGNNDDSLTYFSLFLDCDQVAFEEAVKESKRQKAMDVEIAAIERNHTWEFNIFQKTKLKLLKSNLKKLVLK